MPGSVPMRVTALALLALLALPAARAADVVRLAAPAAERRSTATPARPFQPAAAPAPVARPPPPPGPAYGTYAWPVRGAVLRAFDSPDSPFGAGHRGIDIAAAPDTPVLAPADGVVAFAGTVAGALFVSIDHPDGVRTTYSWLSAVLVRAGQDVGRGEPVAATGPGHPGMEPAHLHLGARFAGDYIDPMLLLEPVSAAGLVHLAPLEE